MQLMFKYITSICFLFFVVKGYTQNQQKEISIDSKTDSVVYKTNYGLRLGVDISKHIMSQFNSTYSGFELVGDYRL